MGHPEQRITAEIQVKTHRPRTLLYIGAAAALLIVGVFAARAALAPARAVTVSPLTSTIVVNPEIGDTFASAPSGAAPALTADQAWAQYAQLNGWDTTIPSGVTVQLGLVSVPVGPATAPGAAGLPTSNGTAYVAHDDLAYGYSSPSACPPSTNPYVTQSPASSCLHWTFIDASTGRQIVETWQPAG